MSEVASERAGPRKFCCFVFLPISIYNNLDLIYLHLLVRSGIEYEELLYSLFGQLNSRRLNFVHMAFNILDKDGSGLVEPAEIASVYDASKHPDVVSGKKSSEEVLSEFLETFEVNGDNDGKVSRQEFENYYSHVSASIDDDDYFELMMRNAWHISGGEGWCANSANRRVLVTHADGKQTVEEIKDDLGVKRTDSSSALHGETASPRFAFVPGDNPRWKVRRPRAARGGVL